MAPKTTKLFISYRSLDSAKVDKLVTHLRAITDSAGKPIYDVWQDKNHIVSGQNWWDQIVSGIIGCEVFVFMVSKESVQSPICTAELSYARKRNRPIVPVVLEGEFQHNVNTGKNDLDYWDLIPQELNDMQAQLLFYEGAGWLRKLETAVATFAASPHHWSDIPAAKPLDPRSVNDASNNPATLYARACEAAEKLDIDLAEKLLLRLVNGDSRYQQYAREWIELLRAYDELLRLEADRYLAFELPDQWELYQRQFPKKFITLFDPKDFKSRYGNGADQVAVHQLGIQAVAASTIPAPIVLPPRPMRPASLDLMPAPFAWIDIPAAQVKLKHNEDTESPFVNIVAYSISKYPITNAQYAKFIEAGGYREPKWWTKAGWWQREQDKWTQPRYWTDSDWNGAEQPVVGVSWYESIAFCQWLSDVSGDTIMMPTEDQWQYAAQGDDGRYYPWGPTWDGSRCNNNVEQNGVGKTTLVRQYEGTGDSPFGVVDMSGNIWEWCLTDYDEKTNDISSASRKRVPRGGSWYHSLVEHFRCDVRYGLDPATRWYYFGFRVCRS